MTKPPMTNKKGKFKILLFCFLVFLISCPLSAAQAAIFNNGYIISDIDLSDYRSMSLAEIQEFLERKAGTLDTLVTLDKDGISKPASQIIYEAAQEYQVNPQFLLVMLQKEMSLVEDDTPSQKQIDWAMGYGVCDSCKPNDPAILMFKGFGTQVDRCAGWQRWAIENTDKEWLKQKGRTYTIDGHQVIISNQATANLYNYTPHIHGNYLFWQIWNRWFTQRYPDATLLQAENESGVWLIQNGQRRPFYSKGALVSRFDLDKIIIVSKNELENYEIGAPIKFPNYSLLQAPDDSVYLIVDDAIRKFESKEVLRVLGFNPEEFEQVTEDDLLYYNIGEPITLESSYPSGALLQDNTTGGVFFVQDGMKYPVISRDILKINFPNYKIVQVTPEELEKYPRLGSVKLREGEIVKSKSSSSVFIISNGHKRPVSSGDVFERLGYKWENVVEVDDQTLSNIPKGNYIDLDFKGLK